MKNIKQARFVKLSFLFLAISLLMLFSPLIGKAQDNSTVKCEWVWKYEWEWVWESQYNVMRHRYEPQQVQKQVYKRVYECVPIPVETNSATSSGGNSTYPNVVRNAEGKLNPAEGYQWANPDDPKDFRVKPKRGLVESTLGKLHPASGYQWVNPNDPKDFRVKLMPGLIKTEDGFRPATDYRWINPKDPKDFRVERIP